MLIRQIPVDVYTGSISVSQSDSWDVCLAGLVVGDYCSNRRVDSITVDVAGPYHEAVGLTASHWVPRVGSDEGVSQFNKIGIGLLGAITSVPEEAVGNDSAAACVDTA